MCSITLSYNQNNETARQQLMTLLSTGLFMVTSHDNEVEDVPGMDYSDPSLFEVDENLKIIL